MVKLITFIFFFISTYTLAVDMYGTKINGFMTLSHVQGDPYEDISSLNYSAVGLQATKTTENFKFVGQLRSLELDDWKPDLNWAFVEYKLNDSSFISIGRFVNSIYNFSQTSFVGKSYIWPILPQSVYSLDFNNIDGISYKKIYNINDKYIQFNLSVGRRHGNFIIDNSPIEGKLSEYVGISTFIEDKYWSYHFNYSESRVSVESEYFSDGQYSAANPAIGLDTILEFKKDLTRSVSAYVSYTRDWLFKFEIQRLNVEDSFLVSDFGYYITLGYNIGKFIPYINFSTSRNKLRISKSEFNFREKRPIWQALYSSFYDRILENSKKIAIGTSYTYNAAISFSFQIEKNITDRYRDKGETFSTVASLNYSF